jgi:superfamily II DNA or RNA helicase
MEDNYINTTNVNISNKNIINNNRIINSKLLELLDTYNIIDILQDNDDLKKDGVIYSQSHQNLINNISNQIFQNDLTELYEFTITLKNKISNCLIDQILSNSPKSDITITKFPNIKTQLYPYQVNNLNWMYRIETRIYPEEYKKISSECIIRGGGLFDEVGMGKTLQMITLINLNTSTNTNLVKNNKIFSKATLIIVPNHLCGQWAREFANHTIKPIKIINLLTKVHYHKYTYYDLANADVIIINANFFINCNLNQHEESNPLNVIGDIFEKDVNIFNIYWFRVVIDEFHEIETSNLFVRLKYLESDYRWIISGTPFKETTISSYTEIDKTSLSEILDYLTWDLNMINKINIYDKIGYQYIKDHFSRNTHNANIKILQLPDVNEQTIWLKFTDTERMIYNAYLADPNNKPEDVFLRQICCHPMISDKIRENLSNQVESLSDIQTQIKKMYMSDFEKADEHYVNCLNRIARIQGEIEELEKENKTHLITYSNLKAELGEAKNRLGDLKKVRDGKEKTVMYYKKFVELLDSMENVTQQECTICLDKIKEEDLGITFCGHIYCYSCISTIIKESKTSAVGSKCPNCQKALQLDKIFLISEKKSTEVNNLGTKLAWIIKYIKQTPNKYRIIFSQWDYLLKEVGKVLETNGIHNLYCQGNVYQKDRVLRLFNTSADSPESVKVIMLSSDSTVSGSNLNNAEEVIFLDPVYGDKQHRLNTERQAIGRVIRLGNKHKIINVIRILIKDTIEEDIYKSNQN